MPIKELIDILEYMSEPYLDYPILFEFSKEKTDFQIYLNKNYFLTYRNNTVEKDSLILSFGQVLASLRDDVDANTRVLAENAGISQSYVSQLENGYNLPGDKGIRKLARGLTLTIYETFMNEVKRNQEYTGIVSVDNIYSKFSKCLIDELKKNYEELLFYVREENKNLGVIEETDNNSKVEITKRELKLLNAFRSTDDSGRNIIMDMAKRLAENK